MATRKIGKGLPDSLELDASEAKKQRIVSAAKAVFLKYGYSRVTMNDLAVAAGMSRPALYLVFSKKEDLFGAVIRELANEISEKVHQGLSVIASPLDKLRFVCETWMVEPFEWTSQSAEAKEIYEGSHDFARDAVAESVRLFECDLTEAIGLFPKGALPKGVSPSEAAHLLAAGIAGVKQSCANSADLRKKTHALIATMLRT